MLDDVVLAHKHHQTKTLAAAYEEQTGLWTPSSPHLLLLLIHGLLALVTANQAWTGANRASHSLSRTPAI